MTAQKQKGCGAPTQGARQLTDLRGDRDLDRDLDLDLLQGPPKTVCQSEKMCNLSEAGRLEAGMILLACARRKSDNNILLLGNVQAWRLPQPGTQLA